jgi:hypothetical protein
VYGVRAFVELRETLIGHKAVAKRLGEIESRLEKNARGIAQARSPSWSGEGPQGVGFIPIVLKTFPALARSVFSNSTNSSTELLTASIRFASDAYCGPCWVY